ncbi:MAG: hypothetical protein Q4F05_13800 [bacterium]|nr:hypothetical protein [bacterium]
MRCRRCRRKISQYAKECPYCKEQVSVDPLKIKQYMDQLQQPLDQTRGRKNSYLKSLVCLVSLLFVLLLVSGSGTRTWDSLVYRKDDSLPVNELDQKENGSEVKVLFNNENNETLYFATNIDKQPISSYQIYEQNTKDWKEAPKLVAEHVRLCTRDAKENLYYVTDEDAYLYKYDGKNTKRLLLPFISQLQYVNEDNRLLVICKTDHENGVQKDGSYERPLEEEWMNSDRTVNSLYHVMPDTFTEQCIVEDLGEQYKVSETYHCVYYLQNNRLFQCKTENEEAVIFKTNVSDFALMTVEETEALYYVQYQLTERRYYDYVKDPYQAADDQVEESVALSKKETKKEYEERQMRNELRLELLNQVAYTYKGTLHCYAKGKDKAYKENVSGLSEAKKDNTLSIYKSKEFSGDYVIPKEGGREIVDQLAMYFSEPVKQQEGENYYTAALYDYNEQTNAIPIPRTVLIMYEPTLYEIIDGEMTKSKRRT